MKSNVLMCVAAGFLSGCGCEQVDTGFRGIKTNMGAVIGEPLPEGLHWYNPITESIREFEVREQKFEFTTACFTKDTQNVNITFALTYYPDPSKVTDIFKQFGKTWDEKIIAPATPKYA